MTAAIELDPWGAATNRMVNASQQPRWFTTYLRDGVGSDEAMHRRYNRYYARFEQADPYDGSYDLTDPQSLNRYSYTQNDPVNFVDPTGLDDTIYPFVCVNCHVDVLGRLTGVGGGNLGLGGEPRPGDGRGGDVGGGAGSGTLNSPQRQLDPNSQECKDLAKRISNIRRDIEEMRNRLEVNPGGLDEAGIRQHRNTLSDAENNLERRINEYHEKCGGGAPPPVPVRPPVLFPPGYKYPKNRIPRIRVPIFRFPTIPLIIPNIPICVILGNCTRTGGGVA